MSLENYKSAKAALGTVGTLFANNNASGTFTITTTASSLANASSLDSDTSVNKISIFDNVNNIINKSTAISTAITASGSKYSLNVKPASGVIKMSEADYNGLNGLQSKTALVSALGSSLTNKIAINDATLAHSAINGVLDNDSNVKSISVLATVTPANVSSLSSNALSKKVNSLNINAAMSDVSSLAAGSGRSSLLTAVVNLGKSVSGFAVTDSSPTQNIVNVDVTGLTSTDLKSTLTALSKLTDRYGTQEGLNITGATFKNIATITADQQVSAASVSDNIYELKNNADQVHSSLSSAASTVSITVTDTADNVATNVTTLQTLLAKDSNLNLQVQGLDGSAPGFIGNLTALNTLQDQFKSDRIRISLLPASSNTITVNASLAGNSNNTTELGKLLTNNSALKLKIEVTDQPDFVSHLSAINTLQSNVNLDNGSSKISFTLPSSSTDLILDATVAGNTNNATTLKTLLTNNSTLNLRVEDTGLKLASKLDDINNLLTTVTANLATSRMKIVQSDSGNKLVVTLDQYENDAATIKSIEANTLYPIKNIEINLGNVAAGGVSSTTNQTLLDAEDIGQILNYSQTTPVTPAPDRNQTGLTFDPTNTVPMSSGKFRLNSSLVQNLKLFSDVAQFDLHVTSSTLAAVTTDSATLSGITNIARLGTGGHVLKIDISA